MNGVANWSTQMMLPYENFLFQVFFFG